MPTLHVATKDSWAGSIPSTQAKGGRMPAHTIAERLKHRLRSRKREGRVAEAFHEVMHHEPSTVRRADVSAARKRKMRIAIALNKARKAGAHIPPQ